MTDQFSFAGGSDS
jgi:hypothetical protein